VLILEDEAGGDEKILAVPDQTTFPLLREDREGEDLPAIVRQQIEHFFTHYKDLEPEKWVRVGKWEGRERAEEIILHCMEQARKAKA
jgi:inorganic pyrophosphatase